jgi:hypothetical protein
MSKLRRQTDTVSAAEFNRLAARLAARRVTGGEHVRCTRTFMGQIITLGTLPEERHAWQTEAAWNPFLQKWTARIVVPGSVNGLAPLVNAGSYYVQDGKQPAVMTLDGIPELLLNFRAIGHDGTAGESVPEFFANMGVGKQPKAAAPDEPVNLTELAAQPGNRLLRACDLVLIQPRPAMKTDVQLGDALVDGWTLRQSVNYTTPSTTRARVVAQAKFIYPGQSFKPEDFDQALVERDFDAIQIATIYLVSPPDTEDGTDPDATWQPFIKHVLFYDLNYATPRADGTAEPDPVTFFIPTVAGAMVQPLVSALLALANDVFDALKALLTAQSNEGRFWSV